METRRVMRDSRAFRVGLVGTVTVLALSGGLGVVGASWSHTTTSPSYSVVFKESGLPAGTNWSVTFNGSTLASTLTSVRFSAPNGSYAIEIGSPPGYGVAKIVGTGGPNQTAVNVWGNSTFRIAFGPLETLTFGESGLATYLPWTVSLQPALAHGGPEDQESQPLAATAGPSCGASRCGAMAYDAAKGEMFVLANTGAPTGGHVLVVNDTSDSIVADVPLGEIVNGIAYDPAMKEVFVAGGPGVGSGYVRVISDTTNTVVGNVTLGGSGGPVLYDAARGEVVVGNTSWLLTNHGSLTVINDTSNAVATVVALPTGAVAQDLALVPSPYTPGLEEVWVSTAGNVTIINDTWTRIWVTMPVPSSEGLAYDPAQGEVVVTSPVSCNGSDLVDTMSVLTNTPTQNIRVGSCPLGVAFDPARGEAFVANSGDNTVSVVTPGDGEVVATVSLDAILENSSSAPEWVAYDPGQGEVFVASAGFGDPLVVLNDKAPASVNFTVPAGATYRFSIEGPGVEYRAVPSKGAVHVPAHALAKAVKFKLLTEPIVFRETNLSALASWTVTITNGTTPAISFPLSATKAVGTGAIRFLLPVGTYHYTLSATNTQTAPGGSFTVVSAPSPAQVVPVTFS